MLKKFFASIGAIILICFSFYYTDTAVDIVKRNDPIMKEIESVSSSYYIEPIDATLKDNSIIPGVSGIQVDIDKSYEKMKKYGSFEASLLVFSEVIPTVSTNNTYDRFIVGGNSSKQSISLIFKMYDTNYLNEILEILKLKNIKATFFIAEDIVNNDIEILEKIYLMGHSIEILSDNYSNSSMKKANKILKSLLNNGGKFCYTESENNQILTSCQKNKMYTIIPNIITSNFPYTQIKNKVTGGSMISFSNNIATIRELPSIINYLNQKGHKAVMLEQLLDE